VIGKIHAAHVLLDDGWASPGHVIVDAAGAISEAAPGALAGADLELSGYVVPGIANLHSHAHHRGLVGYADRLALGGVATLWTWRESMYRHLLGLMPDDLEAYATLAYIEMLHRGYTAVGEFHYLHHDHDGRRYGNPAEMSERIIAAARSAGIALTVLPALYGSGGVGKPPEPDQRRFTIGADEYLSLLATLDRHTADDPLLRVGAAPHSLRAVDPAELEALLAGRTTGPIHIHAAERTEEVDEVAAGLGARPIEWLLGHTPIDGRWCVIHATHMTESERRGLAHSGAVAGLCPLTEANLADGLFPLASYRHDGGRLGIGTDANHLIDLPGELRMLEYGQRVTEHRRDGLLAEGETSVGDVLFRLAAAGGAQALAQPVGAIRPGVRCDLVELDPDHPAFAGQIPTTILDTWVFSTASDAVVRTVIVGGEIVIRDGHHPLESAARLRVEAVMSRRHSVTAPPS
jgi:formimidoylglutamate deiminase